MALYLLYGEGYNALARMATAATPESAATKYPIANLYDGIPNKPFIFNTAGGSGYIDFDLNQIVNGEFGTAFSGGLPGTGWGTSGATLTRVSSTMQVTGTFGVDYGYYDLIVPSGQLASLTITANPPASGVGGSAVVQVQNLTTGSWLTSAGAWQTATASYISTTLSDTTPVTNAKSVTIESYAVSLSDLVTLRFYFYAGSSDTPAHCTYDNVLYWPDISFFSVHGHNLGGVGLNALVLTSGATSPGTTTTRATIALAKPTMFAVFTRGQDRHWRIALAADPPSSAAWFGEMVLSYSQTATRRQNYGQDYALIDPQDRTQTDIGPLQAFIRTSAGRRQVSLQFRLNDTATDYAQWKEILERSRNGAFPLVVVVESGDTSTAIMGRVDPRWSHTRVTNNVRDHSLVLDEMPLPVVVA